MSESLSEETKPIPGEKGVCAIDVLDVGSVFRRQERARTPVRRISVPKAIYCRRLVFEARKRDLEHCTSKLDSMESLEV